MKLRDRQILHIAIPSIVSNITVPLLGLVDLAITGHLGSAVYIGAIAVGTLMFNIIYWIFAFLRMGTSGLTSQAYGHRDLPEVMATCLRSVGVALIIALALLLLQVPIRELTLLIVKPEADVANTARLYFSICIWGAPAMLSLYALNGWFLGMQNSRAPLAVAVIQNVANIIASLSLVYGLGMKIEGVALGTLTAQYVGLAVSILIWCSRYSRLRKYLVVKSVWERKAMLRFFSVNHFIFFRTLCLVAVTLFFTSAGARQDGITLAANAVLMQLFVLFSYFMDGFAYAGEALCGRFIGAQNRAAYSETVRRLFVWGAVMTVIFTLIYAFGSGAIVSLLTSEQAVIETASRYLGWTTLIPVAGVAAFIWDGVFIGATATRQMLISMATATAVFFATFLLLGTQLHNHALWLSFDLYLAFRGLMQTFMARGVRRHAFCHCCNQVALT